jgi:hypothetical protein
MLKKLLKNKKGTAEVIGSVMFIVILLFFFTSVYLWHDAAVKDMNDLYAEKLNSQISIEDKTTDDGFIRGYNSGTKTLLIKNIGGVDAIIESVWINHEMEEIHINSQNNELVVRAGSTSLPLHLIEWITVPDNIDIIKVVTTTGNIAVWRPNLD